LYNQIFFTNVLRLLDERNMTKNELSEMAGISVSFLSDLTNGKANPSLKIMEAIAEAFNAPLPMLLEMTDLCRDDLAMLAEGKNQNSLPNGYERVSAILPKYQASMVKKWDDLTRQKLRLKS
jgi:transcriptional regulator with XRE-family HTH domain